MSQTNKDEPIIIIGAGIAGLCAALALSQKGYQVHLYEKEKKPQEFGAGIQIPPNATQFLIKLGLEASLKKIIFQPENLHIQNGKNGKKWKNWKKLGRTTKVVKVKKKNSSSNSTI